MEMYLQGVSTRSVKAVTEQVCGHEFSSSTVSRIVQGLDEDEEYPYVVLDARSWIVRESGSVRSQRTTRA